MALTTACGGGGDGSGGSSSAAASPPVTSSGDSATFSVQQVAGGFEAYTGDSSPPSVSFNVYLQNVPQAGLFIQPSQPHSGIITSVTDTQSIDSGGQVTVAISMVLESPATLGSGFFTSSVTFSVCYDQACEHQLPGSPVTQPISLRVYLTAGREYTLRTVNLDGISDLAYDAVGQSLYASSVSSASDHSSGSITPIDPISGKTGATAPLNDSLFGIAVSDDGSFLYVGSAVNPVLYRLSLPSLALNLTIPLGDSSEQCCSGDPNTVSEVAAAPGAPHTVAVSFTTQGTVVYDDAVARQQTLQPLGYYAGPDAIAWGDSAASLIVYRYSSELPLAEEIATVAVSASGLTVTSSVSLDPATFSFGIVFYAAGRAYDLLGHVVDATSGAALGQFTLPFDSPIVTLLPDPSHGRVFVLQSYDSHLYLLAYDASTFQMQSVINLNVDADDVALTTHMILWGSDGIAFNRNGVQILSGTFIASATTSGSMQATSGTSAPILTLRNLHVQPRSHSTPLRAYPGR